MNHTLESFEVYNLAEKLSDIIWANVVTWDMFTKDTIGKQLVRAAVSISANIAEGYGRFHFKESKQFYFYARGSIQETKSWVSKCKRRNILNLDTADQLLLATDPVLKKLNAYLSYLSKLAKGSKD